MLSIKFSEPFNGRLAASGDIAGWLLQAHLPTKNARIWKLVEAKGDNVTEMDLFEFLRDGEPLWRSYLKVAGLEDVIEEAARRLDVVVMHPMTDEQLSLLDAA